MYFKTIAFINEKALLNKVANNIGIENNKMAFIGFKEVKSILSKILVFLIIA